MGSAMGEISSIHDRFPPGPADRRLPARTGPRSAAALDADPRFLGVAASLRNESVPALFWRVDHQLRVMSGPASGNGLDDTGTSLYDHYQTNDPDHPAIRAHRLALADRKSTRLNSSHLGI